MLVKYRYHILFWSIFAAAVLVRCIGFVSVPAGINQDEAMAGVDAWALAQYATDRFGTFLPVHFTAWRYGQMSVLLSYCMVPFIKLFGFGTFAVRLPMLLTSCGSVVLVYLVGKKLFGTDQAFLVMALTAINPWHFMQSRWSLDCNLFPHMFLLAFYLLLLGLEKRRYLYLSMIFFGLTLYCYGVAVYAVLPFLAAYAAWCVKKRQLKMKEILLCMILFSLVALPEIMVMAINFFGWHTVQTPFFTMSYFPESVRSRDILFLNFSVRQLIRNFMSMVDTCILQRQGPLYNALPDFGPMYYISIPFMLLGITDYIRRLTREKDIILKTKMHALWLFFLTGIWVGLVTFEVNVNRINIMFFPLIFLCSQGIMAAVQRIRSLKCVTAAAYILCFLLFMNAYFTSFAEKIQVYFNVNFIEVITKADRMEEYDRLYITANADWQSNWRMTEILTQYACRIDAAYYQEKTLITGGRKLLPYSQRYHFVDVNHIQDADLEGLYVMHESDLEKLPFPYEIIAIEGRYVLLRPLSSVVTSRDV